MWVEVEQRGKSSVIRDNQYARLEAEYNNAVSKMFSVAAAQRNTPATPTNTNPPQQRPPMQNNTTAGASSNEYRVQSVKPSGKASQLLELVNPAGQVISAYIKVSDKAVKPGSKLQNVSIVPKQSSYGQYNLISGYQIAA